jgi:hypothetical protein
MAPVPGKIAHDAYCSEDDFHTLDPETVALWVTVEDDVIEAYGGGR